MLLTGGSGATPQDIAGLGVPVLSRMWWPAGVTNPSSLSNGTDTYALAQRRHVALRACSSVRVAFVASTAYEDPAGGVTSSNIPGTITVAACLFKQSANPNGGGGTPLDVPWGVASTVDMTDGQIAVSDPVAGLTFAQGDIVWSRTLVTVPSGGKWPLGWLSAGAVIGYDGLLTGTGAPPDLRTASVTVTNATNTGFHPVFALGVLS